ncbi:hypothetical protein K7640_12790 [Micromonospora sp. PLK6-60]|uniref:hypothetical protein n=1 Tax=Micromonospora sp. PLK6-60 TaxID=2873383 RepID=UPI001CA63734|nr:hypothetical protein [Micromonospora sp. PLK6-60]MBY8872712.1 hypothetical protein [Micromonospora sp. PLK6-60]
MTAGASARDGGELDGFHLGHLLPGIGELVSDFATEWEDVSFATRVWERPVGDGYRVDLRVHVLRGERLADLGELRDFLAEYHERDAAAGDLADFAHPDGPRLIGATEALWLAAPGVAVDVLVDPEAADAVALRSIAQGVRGPGAEVGTARGPVWPVPPR